MRADITLSGPVMRRLELLASGPRAYNRNDPHNKVLLPAGLIESTGKTDGLGRPGWRITTAGRARLFREQKKPRARPILDPNASG